MTTSVHAPGNGARPAPRRFLLARAAWIVVVTLATVIGAAAYSWNRTATYQSSAQVLIRPSVLTFGTAPQAPDMGSEALVAKSSTVLGRAARAAGADERSLAASVSVSVPLNTHVLEIDVSSPDPGRAQRWAQAVAQAYVDYSLDQRPTRIGADGQQILPVSVISDGTLPAEPTSPDHLVDLLIAVILGVTLGVSSAFVRDRMDGRVRAAGDVVAAGAGPALAVLGHRSARRGTPAVLRHQKLLRVLRGTVAQHPTRSVLVTSAADDGLPTLAGDLAAAIASTGCEVRLVCAARRPATPVPGVTVLSSEFLYDDIAASGPTGALRLMLRRVGRGADLVVLDCPGVLENGAAAALADAADHVILSVRVGRTTRADVDDVLDLLRPLRGTLLGSVLHRGRGRKSPTATAESATAARDGRGDIAADTPGLRDDPAGNNPKGNDPTDNDPTDAVLVGTTE